ncbi:MAG: 3-dehydroquinate synthase II [Candidatus Jordarchaeum sp.]|uniref:3-dehydroquinate synthase II n=1 Tax=Candidatus Jordarchaeum sp. TaxID=2823881 RepID=UPI004048EF7E
MKKIIIRLNGNWEDVREIAIISMTSGINTFIADEPLIPQLRQLGSTTIFSSSQTSEPDVLITTETNPEEISKIMKQGKCVACLVDIRAKEDEEKVIELSKRGVPYIIVKAEDWKIIPLENLIAELHKSKTELFAEAESRDEANTLFQTLELGVDGVIFTPQKAEEIPELEKIIEEPEKIVLISAKVIEVREVGSGDRVCVDTCSLLRTGEGMLIGSQSQGLFLIHSETLQTEFAEPRPFRVNAGAVHAYVLMADGKTKYLSELEAGDKVLAVDYLGNCREVIVGRVKIEKRPLLLVKAKLDSEDMILKTLTQNAETVNLVNKEGKPISVAKLKTGDEIIVYSITGGRHFGKTIKETIIEK